MCMILFILTASLPSLGGINDNPNKTCNCEENRKKDGWCSVCKKGYLAGLEIKSALLFETMDAHGHDVQVERFICETCKKSYASDGYCEQCRIGFVKQRAFLSRLTYEIARGKHVVIEELPCENCKKMAAKYGWCEECGCGFVGHVAITERPTYAIVETEWKKLLSAIELISKCETCGLAYFTGGKCLKCNLSYKTGQAVEMTTKPSG